MNNVANTSTKVVDQSVDSSASTTITWEINIVTATTEAAASATLDVLYSVPEPGNTATTEDSVSMTEAAASKTLDVSSSTPEKGKQGADNTRLLLLANLFRQLIQNMISPCDHLATKKSKSSAIAIGLKKKIGNPGYITMQKNKQFFVWLM